jgi:hypothetical protein
LLSRDIAQRSQSQLAIFKLAMFDLLRESIEIRLRHEVLQVKAISSL